jgi:lipid A biosynthesis-like protein
MAGSGCLLIYGIHKRDSVFIFAYLFTWIPYIRNLMIGDRVKRTQVACASCETPSPANARFCAQCGVKLQAASSPGTG